MSTPKTLGLVSPPATTPAKPPRCPACTDFGTVLLGRASRQPRTMPEILQHEAPCTCAAGDLWRELFAEFETPLPAARKGS